MDSLITYSEHPRLQRLFPSKEDKGRMLASAARGWVKVERTLEQLAAQLDKGTSIAAHFIDGHRCTESAVTQFIVLDFDEGNPELERIEAALNTLGCAYITGETGSSRAGDRRYRVTLPLAERISQAREFDELVQRVIHCFPADIKVDLASQKIAQPWFGHQRGTTQVHNGAFLPLEAIRALPMPTAPLKIVPPGAAHKRKKQVSSSSVNWAQERSLWIEQAVIPLLDRVTPAVTQGRYSYRHCPNPHHVDKRPSFRVSYDKTADGIGVCSCGSYSMTTLAQWIGAPDLMTWWRTERAAFFPKRKSAVAQDQTDISPHQVADLDVIETVQEAPVYWPKGVPDGVRSAILRLLLDSCVLVVELINHALQQQLLNATDFTFPQLAKLNSDLKFNIPTNTLRKAFNALEGEFVAKLAPNPRSESPDNTCKQSGRGRRTVHWRLLPTNHFRTRLWRRLLIHLVQKHYPTEGEEAALALIDEEMLKVVGVDTGTEALIELLAMIAEQQGQAATDAARKLQRDLDIWKAYLHQPCTTCLPGDAWKRSTFAYRAAVLHAEVAAKPDLHRTIEDQARKVGSAKSSLKAIRNRAKVNNIPQFSYLRVKATNVSQVQRSIRSHGASHRGFPRAIEICDRTGKHERWLPFEQTEETYRLISLAVHDYKQVFVRFQVASKQELVDAMPVVIREPIAKTQKLKSIEGRKKVAPPKQNAIDPMPATEAIRPQPVRRCSHKVDSYDPVWVTGQLKLAFACVGWVNEGRLVDPNIWEIFPEMPPVAMMITILQQQAQRSAATLIA